ncbi:hypothetical protein SBRY_10486 [Actinacidiphila bryophytorum]|uniref:Uncharacterized protein n=1 Tax=Actinacidiphila bryophytorum TaxID=1436133 RepID=A0A9W4GWU9_9ACTN|nr:hypothetical protein SBRY_10486 [Actinacidiphila bryophytorum]
MHGPLGGHRPRRGGPQGRTPGAAQQAGRHGRHGPHDRPRRDRRTGRLQRRAARLTRPPLTRSRLSPVIVRLVVSSRLPVAMQFFTTVPTRSSCDPDQRQRHLADPGGVRPAQGRAGASVWSRARRDRRQDRGSPPGRRSQGERGLSRGA